jgi:pimeloyl-ACP methyl ester carboxylesterase
MTNAPHVILLHGAVRRARSMVALERALAAAGFGTRNIGYPSRKYPIEILAEIIHPQIAPLAGEKLHFVCHSMGGLVARAYIARYRAEPLGRVVMLGTPNQGSELADFWGGNPIFKWVFGPAGQQLRTTAPPPGPAVFEAGIIAGTRALDPLGWLYLPKPNDGRVTVARTKLSGAAAHITLPANHETMMRNPAVQAQVIAFLRAGQFTGPA